MAEVQGVPLSDGTQAGESRPAEVAAPAVEVGVLLTMGPGGLGEWLADAAAFDAGGVHALWIEAEPELDVLALAAALAVVTFRARLVVALPEPGATPATVGRTLRTIGRLSNGRLALIAGADAGDASAGVEIFRRVPGEPGAYLATGTGGASADTASGEAGERRWVPLPAPQGRADPGERHDLQIAQG